MTTKSRTITYLRAVWQTQGTVSTTLQQILERCLTSLPNVENTQIPLRDGLAEIRHRNLTNDQCYLHIAAWTAQEEVSTVPHEQNVVNSDLSSQAPGNDYDFLDGDGMMLISKNHCLLMPSGLHPKSIEQYVRNLIGHAKNIGVPISEAEGNFKLLQIEDKLIIKEIIDAGGIKKVDLNVGRYMETVKDDADKFKPRKIIEELGSSILECITLKDATRRQIEEAENIHAKLIITFDSRRSGLKHEEFDSIAQDVASENLDDVELVTKSGKRIKNSELTLKKSVRIEAFGKTVHHNIAREEMEIFFEELKNSGTLEE